MLPRRIAVVVLLVAVMAGCDQPGGAAPAPSPSEVVTTETVTPSPEPTVAETVTESPSVAEPTQEPTAGPSPGDALVAQPDGLGLVRMGDDADTVIEVISGRLGEPDDDSGWQPKGSVYGVCAGEQTRVVTWGQLTAVFSDGPSTYAPAGTPHLLTYETSDWEDPVGGRGQGPQTQDGVGVGSTRAELEAAYPPEDILDVAPADEPRAGYWYWALYIDPLPERRSDGLYGFLTGDGPDDVVVSLGAGEACGE